MCLPQRRAALAVRGATRQTGRRARAPPNATGRPGTADLGGVPETLLTTFPPRTVVCRGRATAGVGADNPLPRAQRPGLRHRPTARRALGSACGQNRTVRRGTRTGGGAGGRGGGEGYNQHPDSLPQERSAAAGPCQKGQACAVRIALSRGAAGPRRSGGEGPEAGAVTVASAALGRRERGEHEGRGCRGDRVRGPSPRLHTLWTACSRRPFRKTNASTAPPPPPPPPPSRSFSPRHPQRHGPANTWNSKRTRRVARPVTMAFPSLWTVSLVTYNGLRTAHVPVPNAASGGAP